MVCLVAITGCLFEGKKPWHGDLKHLHHRLLSLGLKASTVRTRLDSLKAFIRYQVEKGVISADVLLKRMIIKVPDALPKAMEMEDEAKLLSVIDDIRNRAMIVEL